MMEIRSNMRREAGLDGETIRRDPSAGFFSTRLWLACSVWCVIAGWVLSLLHAVSERGYVCAGFATLAVLLFNPCGGKAFRAGKGIILASRKAGRRIREPLPACFFLIAALALAAGLSYAPSNGDALDYRIPRVLHWLSQGRWHWLHTDDGRANYFGTATEWLSAPIIALTHSDRALSLLSFIPFLQLPGFIFIILQGLNVSGRTARAWMWPLAGTLGFAQQASSGANDLLGAFYAAAAIGLALRAGRNGSFADWAWSAIAMALLTDAKYSNIPLGLPWLAASVRCWPLIRVRMLRTCGVMGTAAAVSCSINVFLNHIFARTWLGIPSETVMSASPDPFWAGFIVNGTLAWVENLAPPILPWPDAWNAHLSSFFSLVLGSRFESYGGYYGLGRAVVDGSNGLGLVVIVIVCSLVAGIWGSYRMTNKNRPGGGGRAGVFEALFLISVLLATVFFLCRINSLIATARILFPYYLPLTGGVLGVIPTAMVVRRRWWRIAMAGVMLSSVPLLVISRERPLWPTMQLMRWAESRWPASRPLRQVEHSYTFVPERLEVAKPLLGAIPQGVRIIGMAGHDVPAEALLWEPYGSRSVIRILASDSEKFIRDEGIRYVITDRTGTAEPSTPAMEKEIAAGRIVATSEARREPEGPLRRLELVELPP